MRRGAQIVQAFFTARRKSDAAVDQPLARPLQRPRSSLAAGVGGVFPVTLVILALTGCGGNLL